MCGCGQHELSASGLASSRVGAGAFSFGVLSFWGGGEGGGSFSEYKNLFLAEAQPVGCPGILMPWWAFLQQDWTRRYTEPGGGRSFWSSFFQETKTVRGKIEVNFFLGETIIFKEKTWVCEKNHGFPRSNQESRQNRDFTDKTHISSVKNTTILVKPRFFIAQARFS